MLFNSWEFAVFLPLVLLCYYSLNRKAQNFFLVICSYFFYGWWDYRFCALLAISTFVDYYCGLALASTSEKSNRKIYLLVSCATNLGILGFFKYFNFFIDSLITLFDIFSFKPDIPTLRIILPVGISFYTFQTLSYTIDVYRGKLTPTKEFFDFALYVSFFPQLVAGPIERATRLLPQIQQKRSVCWEKISSGCLLILIGLVRKIAIADGIASVVNQIFNQPAEHGSFQLLIGIYLFSLQIYCDFSGYTDIARGVSRLLGIELMENFQHPYFSRNITEFWRRWHISLSSWLRDYLYIPLGGNRKGTFFTYRNLFLTMLIGGLWHGANWTFVMWGGIHGMYLAIHKFILKEKKPAIENRNLHISWHVDLAKMFFTFHLVAFTWVFFRAQSFGIAWEYLSGIIAFSGGWPIEGLKYLCAATVLLFLIDIPQYITNNHTIMLRWPWPVRSLGYTLFILTLFIFRTDGKIPFIYFQF